MSISINDESFYTSLAQSLDYSSRVVQKINSAKNSDELALVQQATNTTNSSDKVQTIDLSSYYQNLNSLGIDTSSSSESEEGSEASVQNILNSALENGQLSDSQTNQISKALLNYKTNSMILQSTFELSV